MELRKYWEIVCRRKWILIQAALLIPLFTFILFVTVTPVYKSEAKLLFRPTCFSQKFIPDIPDEVGTIFFFNDDDAMGSIEEMLESGSVVGQVIRKMDLRDEDGDLFKIDEFVDPFVIGLIFQKTGVHIDNISDSETFEVTGYSSVPSEAKVIAERVISAFSDTFAETYKESANRARRAIESRIQELNKRLIHIGEVRKDYKTKNDIFDIAIQIETLISEISNLVAERNENRRALKTHRLNIETIRNASLGQQLEFRNALVSVEDSNVIDDYKTELLTFETDLAGLKVERTAEHPEIKTLKNKIKITKDVLRNEISKTFASQIVGSSTFYDDLASEYSNSVISIVTTTAMEKVLTEQIEKRRKILDQMPEKQQKMNEFTRKVGSLTVSYDSFVNALEVVKSVEGINLSNALVIQPPSQSNISDNYYFPPERRKYPMAMAIAILLGMFFGTCLIFLLEYLDDNLWSLKEIESTLNQKVTGSIPRVRKRKLDIGKMMNSPIVASGYNLLANIKLFKGGEVGKVVSIVSPMRQEGKSVLAAILASVIAQQGKKVILIDGNLRYPSQHSLFSLSNETGLGNCLLGDVKFQEIICSTSINNMDVITSGSLPVEDPQGYLGSDSFLESIKKLMTDYDVILLDTPAFVDGSDALVISRHAEDVLCVVAQGKTSRPDAQNFMRAMEMAKIKILGIVLNKARY